MDGIGIFTRAQIYDLLSCVEEASCFLLDLDLVRFFLPTCLFFRRLFFPFPPDNSNNNIQA